MWIKEEAWQWGREPFQNGIKERLIWKIENTETSISFHRAIIDEELFLMAIAADLRNIERQTQLEDTWDLTITEILDKTYTMFKQEGTFFDDGTWLFQIGVWSEHPDYAYTGSEIKDPSMESKIVADISQDTSHFHRFPVFLKSLESIYTDNQEEKEFYSNIRNGLRNQFMQNVLVYPTEYFEGYRTRNFIDGNNGIYRWNYATKSNNNGYGPYELSGTFNLGWWRFLGGSEISETYRTMSLKYPLQDNVIDLYVGPNTTRERNPYVTWPDFFKNGFSELISRLAYKLPI